MLLSLKDEKDHIEQVVVPGISLQLHKAKVENDLKLLRETERLIEYANNRLLEIARLIQDQEM